MLLCGIFLFDDGTDASESHIYLTPAAHPQRLSLISMEFSRQFLVTQLWSHHFLAHPTSMRAAIIQLAKLCIQRNYTKFNLLWVVVHTLTPYPCGKCRTDIVRRALTHSLPFGLCYTFTNTLTRASRRMFSTRTFFPLSVSGLCRAHYTRLCNL